MVKYKQIVEKCYAKNASKKDWFPNDIAVVVCTCHTKFLQIQTDCYTQSNIFRVPVCKFPRFSAIKLNGNQSFKKSQVHHTIVISCKNVFAFWRQIWITRYFSLNFQQHFNFLLEKIFRTKNRDWFLLVNNPKAMSSRQAIIIK